MDDIKDKNVMIERSEENWKNNKCKVSGKKIDDDFYLYPKGFDFWHFQKRRTINYFQLYLLSGCGCFAFRLSAFRISSFFIFSCPTVQINTFSNIILQQIIYCNKIRSACIFCQMNFSIFSYFLLF